ncbi:MAG: YdjY domain-containing protein [Luteolibacter sp.]
MRALILLLFTTLLPAREEKPPVEKTGETTYRIGQITFDSKTREIRLPTIVNQREGLLEFLLVHQNGKIHESLLRTTASPTHLNLALTLLRYKPSRELYRVMEEHGVVSEKFFQEDPENKKAARLSLEIEYRKNKKALRSPASDWIRNDTIAQAMPPTHWVYGGSEIYQGTFIPESTGDIAAIFITNTALINYPGTGNLNDEIWTAHTNRIPDLETKATLIIAPYKE